MRTSIGIILARKMRVGRLLVLFTCTTLLACCGAEEARRPAVAVADGRSRTIAVDDHYADEILALSRQAQWTFPSSSGRPVKAEAPAWALRLVDEREAVVGATKQLLARGDRAGATELAANAWRTWVLARDDAGGRAFLSIVLDGPSASPSAASRFHALALYGDGLFAFRLGDLVGSRARNEAALAEAQKVGGGGGSGDREAEALALLGLSRVELSTGRHEDAAKHAAASRERLREGLLDPAFGQAPLHMLAQATRLAGSWDEAAKLFEQSLALNRRLGDPGMVIVELTNLGHVELRRGDVDKAQDHFGEAATLAGDATDPYDVAMRIFNRAAIAFAVRDRARARALLVEMRTILDRSNVKLATDDQHEVDDLSHRLEAAKR